MTDCYDDPSIFDDPNVLVGIKETVLAQVKNFTPSEFPQFLDCGLQSLPLDELLVEENIDHLLALLLASPHPTKIDFRRLYYMLTKHAGKTELLQVSKELLPKKYLEKCKTETQIQAWYEHTESYLNLHLYILTSEISAYSRRDASRLPLYPHKFRDIYGGLTDLYLALYDLLQYGFMYIKSFLEDAEEGIKEEISQLNLKKPESTNRLKELKKLRRRLLQIKPDLQSPGGTLRAIVYNDAEGKYHTYFKSYFRFDPKVAHEIYNIDMALRYEPQTVTEEQRVYYQKTFEKSNQEFDAFTYLEEFCIQACKVMAEDQQDEPLKKKLKDYKAAKENIDLWLQPLLHPRHTKVFQIVKGELF